MTFKERVEHYTTTRDAADKALKRYMKMAAKAEALETEWKALADTASQALKNLKEEAEQP